MMPGSKVAEFFITPCEWMPLSWEKTFSPTTGWVGVMPMPREPGDQPRCLNKPFLLNPGPDAVHRLHDHHGLGKVGIAGPFPEPVYGHLHLRCTGFDGGDRVCDRKPEVVVAVDIDRAPDFFW